MLKKQNTYENKRVVMIVGLKNKQNMHLVLHFLLLQLKVDSITM